MYLYCDNIANDIEDESEYKIEYETLFYTANGIYKKYKKHFYKLKINHDVKYIKHNNKVFFIQQDSHVIDKNTLITNIPFKHYCVNRKIMITNIDENITFVKEIDNDIYDTKYFIVENSEYDTLNKICLFLNINL